MVAFKLQDFGGQVPAVDDRLLPQSAAALAQNAWTYTGALEGMRQLKLIYTPSNGSTKKVYRIPKQYYDKEHIADSYWLEFVEMDTDVIHSPTVGDTYDRYYWASSQKFYPQVPQYNTKDRIAAGLPPFTLGVPTPTVGPAISSLTGKYVLDASASTFYTSGRSAALYRKTNFALDADSFIYGAPDAAAKNLNFSVKGGRAELRYKSTVGNVQVTIDDQGNVTKGIPAAVTSSVSVSGATAIPGTWAYVYTWVTAYGEESAPSPATLYTGNVGDGKMVRVTLPDASVTTNRNITKTRVYRTVTSSSGSATYFYVGEFPITQTLFSDALDDAAISANAQLASTYWTPPPSDLEGMISMPNGIVAGFRKNEIWFCEPFRPHAWPVGYTISTEYPIVGLGVTGQTLVVGTTGYPYAVTGINPSNMSMSRVATYEPCLSRGSIVSAVDGVYYASPNGVVRAFGYVIEVISKQMIAKDHWLDYLYVQTLRSARLNGAYYTWGSVRPGCFEGSAFDPDSYLEDDYSGAYRGALMDFANQRVSYTTLYTSDPVLNVTTDPWTGEVFVLRKGKLYWNDLSSSNPHAPFKWKSKIFEMPNKRNLEAMRVYFGAPDGNVMSDADNDADDDYDINMQYDDGDLAIARVYADGNLILARQLETSGEMIRLPSGFKTIYWQIEIEGIVPIYSIEIATSAKELMRV